MHGFQMKGLEHLALTIHKIWEDSQKFYHENLVLRKNNTNHENFRPRKFGAIRYAVAQ